MNRVVLNWHWKYQCKLMILSIHIYVCYCLVTKFCLTHLRPHGLQLTRLLCPWEFPGKNTGMGCHFLLQIIFLTKSSNPGCLHYRFFTPESPGKPHTYIYLTKKHSNKIIMSSIHYQGLRGITLNSMSTYGTQILVLKPFSRIQSTSEMTHSRAKAVEYKTSLEN